MGCAIRQLVSPHHPDLLLLEELHSIHECPEPPAPSLCLPILARPALPFLPRAIPHLAVAPVAPDVPGAPARPRGPRDRSGTLSTGLRHLALVDARWTEGAGAAAMNVFGAAAPARSASVFNDAHLAALAAGIAG